MPNSKRLQLLKNTDYENKKSYENFHTVSGVNKSNIIDSFWSTIQNGFHYLREEFKYY